MSELRDLREVGVILIASLFCFGGAAIVVKVLHMLWLALWPERRKL